MTLWGDDYACNHPALRCIQSILYNHSIINEKKAIKRQTDRQTLASKLMNKASAKCKQSICIQVCDNVMRKQMHSMHEHVHTCMHGSHVCIRMNIHMDRIILLHVSGTARLHYMTHLAWLRKEGNKSRVFLLFFLSNADPLLTA